MPAVFGCLAMLSSVTYGSGDSDAFNCDTNTGRLTQYQFNVGSQSITGNLTWNQNGTLQQLAITDPFNSADQQTCSYTYDDLARASGVNCGSTFNQAFSLGALGNITKTGTLSFTPSYNINTNQITSVGGQNYSYDANGNLVSTGTGTGTNSYSWNAFGGMVLDTPSGGSTVGVNYDALGRAAMTNVNGGYGEFVYAPDGSKLALMNGQTLYKARVELPGGGLAIYDPTGLIRYWHSDWQGSMRLVSSPSAPTYYWSGAYAPYGETYALGSNPFVPDFGSLISDTSGEVDDALFREYNPTQGRWISPDPAGLAAVDLTNPQSLNRYAYVMNSPCDLADPLGLDPCNFNVQFINDAGLTNAQVTAAEQQINALLSSVSSSNGNTVGITWVSNGQTDATLTATNQGWFYEHDPWTSGAFGAASLFLSPRVYINNLPSGWTGPLVGAIGLHELGHDLLSSGDLPYDASNPNTMMWDNMPTNIQTNMLLNPSSSSWQLSPSQIGTLYSKCHSEHPKGNQSGGGGGGGTNKPGIGDDSSAFNSMFMYWLTTPIVWNIIVPAIPM